MSDNNGQSWTDAINRWIIELSVAARGRLDHLHRRGVHISQTHAGRIAQLVDVQIVQRRQRVDVGVLRLRPYMPLQGKVKSHVNRDVAFGGTDGQNGKCTCHYCSLKSNFK